MTAKRIAAVFLICIILFLLVYPSIGSGTLILKVRNTPVKTEHLVERIYVIYKLVMAHPSNVANDSGWRVLANETRRLELVALTNTTELFAESRLTAGKYDMIKIQITNASAIVNGTEVKLETPPRDLMIAVQFTLRIDRETTVLLDFQSNYEEISTLKRMVPVVNATVVR
jgi:hypothetical protein